GRSKPRRRQLRRRNSVLPHTEPIVSGHDTEAVLRLVPQFSQCHTHVGIKQPVPCQPLEPLAAGHGLPVAEAVSAQGTEVDAVGPQESLVDVEGVMVERVRSARDENAENLQGVTHNINDIPSLLRSLERLEFADLVSLVSPTL